MSGDTEDGMHLVDESSPVTVSGRIAIQMVVKIIVGLVLIIPAACVQDFYSVGGFLILIFTGVFLLLDVFISFIPESPIEIKVGSRQTLLQMKREYVRLGVIIFLAFLLMILECSLGPWYWAAGNIVGLIFSIIVLLGVAIRLAVKVLKIEVNAVSARRINFPKFTIPYLQFTQNENGMMQRVLSVVKHGWIGFADNEKCGKKVKQNRVFYFLFSTLIFIMVLCVAAEEFILIKNWSCKIYAEAWIDGAFGWRTVGCNCEFWAGISALCTIIVLGLVMSVAYKPSLPITVIAGTLSFAYGVYMCLLSSYTVQSLMYLGNVTTLMTDNLPFDGPVNRFIHLMPIQYIAVILITLGFILWSNCFDLEQRENRSIIMRILSVLLLLIVAIVAVANMIVSQVNAYDVLRNQWKQENQFYYNKIPWKYAFAYQVYISATIGMSMHLLSCAIYKLMNRNLVIPGILSWVTGLVQFAFSIFSFYSIFHATENYGPDDAPALLILKETPAWILAVNITVTVITCIIGVWNLIRNSVSLINFLLWVGSVVVLPVVACNNLIVNQMEFQRLSSGDQQQMTDSVVTESE